MTDTMRLLLRREGIYLRSLFTRAWLGVLALLCVCALFSPVMMTGYITLILANVMVFNIRANEEVTGAQALDFLLPAPLGQVVLARYLSVVGPVILMPTLCFTAQAAWALAVGTYPLSTAVEAYLVALVMGLYICVLSLPILYRYGQTKGRMRAMVVYVVGFVLIGMSSMTAASLGGGLPSALRLGLAGAVLLLAAGLPVSYRLSVRYAGKYRMEVG